MVQVSVDVHRRLSKSERRDHLLLHAREAFSALGYHNASMDDIAARAGVSKPVLYQHFPGKLDLYLELLDEAAEHVRVILGQALAQAGRADEVVRAMVEAYFGFVTEPAGGFRLVYESETLSEADATRRVQELQGWCVDAIAERVRSFRDLSLAESNAVATSLVGLAQFSARAWFRNGTLSRSDAVDAFTRMAWGGLAGFVGDVD
ncbi:TetR family transcriptional regulator [Dermatophilus congolensis]|uniref:TetR family transcriptional regulator n=1 Tax=Dermatophilus congolensis TaxID=1863 RepID=UPI001AB017FB|nr:TetR/AcrR family transcriptional regulator [Dermatophilus congolensis]MBO3152077.1 TetR/AcrR family transcriptional regulator [Dermatophilus congolensis]MBO3160910.1 TetR/AcrR family transcriptional regulator [Dermatophilus congolensis]MBO3163365.1 TetR/AcrR family transcriptional regulator [Dermatophilus congolensis]MBO3176915.1 TetR/AcrR family transcriptional regulator [Dermatophilus congolensis]